MGQLAAGFTLTGPAKETEVGKGELNHAATWDDFPNGRFGDFKSPAYGELNPWGTSNVTASIQRSVYHTLAEHIVQRDQALSQWGYPKKLEDITSVFLRYLHAKITTTPFSPEPLSPESIMILRHLERLTEKGWWTVGSQPAVDGASSDHEVLGWGPQGGYVYQKCFVEFFVTAEDVARIGSKVHARGKGWVDYFASNAEVRSMRKIVI